MARPKKKRDKVYKGSGAAVVKPSVTRVTAVHRNPVSQWWVDHKRVAKPALITAAVVFIVVLLIIEIVRLLTSV